MTLISLPDQMDTHGYNHLKICKYCMQTRSNSNGNIGRLCNTNTHTHTFQCKSRIHTAAELVSAEIKKNLLKENQ